MWLSPGKFIPWFVFLCAAPLRAAGVDSPDQGVQALSRGGAFAAKADDPSAIYYNPAGLAQQRGTRLLFHSSFLDETASFKRAPSGNDEFSEVSNDNAPFWLPFVAVTSDFGLPRATFALGIFGPNANRFRDWPACVGVEEQDKAAYCGDEEENYAPQRYMGIRQDLFVAFPTVGGAYRLAPWLDLGATFSATYAFVRVQKAANAVGDDSHVTDTSAFLGGKEGGKMEDPFTPVFQVGALARPPLSLPQGHSFELGLSWHTPLVLRLEGDVDIELSEGLSSATVTPEQPHATLVMPIPWKLRGGIRYVSRNNGFEVWDVELDGTYEPYSSIDTVDLEFDPPVQIKFGTTVTLDVVEEPHRWENTGSVRLGGGYNFASVGPGSLHLRAGGNFEGAAAPENYTQLDFLPYRRVGLAGGFGYTWKGLTLQAGYQHSWVETRTISDSEVRTRNKLAQPGQETKGVVVGNGTFRSSLDIFAVGLDVEFDRLLGSR